MAIFDDVIEELYLAFDDVPRPAHIEGCPCCTNDDTLRQQLATDRRELTPDQLSRYARKAISTQGSGDDYLYFFPRIVEIMTEDPGWIDWEIPFGKVGETNPSSWPDRRRQGLETFFLKLLEHHKDLVGYEDVSELFCCVGLSGIELRPFLQALLSYPHALQSFRENNHHTLQVGKLPNAFWGNKQRFDIEKLAKPRRERHQKRHNRHMAAQAEIVAWLRGPEVNEALKPPSPDKTRPPATDIAQNR